MFFRWCLALLLGLATAWTQHPTPDTRAGVQPSIPETPAGRTLKLWLEAFNSGDRGLMDAYCRKYEPSKSVENEMRFRDMIGGFELLNVVKSEHLQLEFLVKERRSETQAVGKLDVKDGDPAEVTSLSLSAIPPGTTVSALDFTIDAATRTRVVDGAIAWLNEFYVFPEKWLMKMEDVARARQKRGEYDSATDGDAFAKMLTEHFQEVSHDKHLRVDFSPARMPEMQETPSAPPPPGAVAQYRQQMERMSGFHKVEILSGNLGYLKVDMFADPQVCGPTAVAAMNFLIDAIIVDLRENGGSDPKMIALVSRYLFSTA